LGGGERGKMKLFTAILWFIQLSIIELEWLGYRIYRYAKKRYNKKIPQFGFRIQWRSSEEVKNDKKT
jgi:hypothetical protein